MTILEHDPVAHVDLRRGPIEWTALCPRCLADFYTELEARPLDEESPPAVEGEPVELLNRVSRAVAVWISVTAAVAAALLVVLGLLLLASRGPR